MGFEVYYFNFKITFTGHLIQQRVLTESGQILHFTSSTNKRKHKKEKKKSILILKDVSASLQSKRFERN